MCAKPRKVTVTWSKPKPVRDAINDPNFLISGVYCITSKREDTERLLYIGKSSGGGGIKGRLGNHYQKWIDDRGGTKYVRMGVVKTISKCDMSEIIDMVESLLIFDSHPSKNIQKMKQYSYNNDCILENCGYYGGGKLFKKKIDSRNHSDENYLEKLQCSKPIASKRSKSSTTKKTESSNTKTNSRKSTSKESDMIYFNPDWHPF